MAISPRLIRRRIRSVQNTRKITKAMELVAAAKMRRAVAAALRTRAYAKLAWEMVDALHGSVAEELHPLLRSAVPASEMRGAPAAASSTRALYVVIASDRGLCGGFHAQLFREMTKGATHVPSATRWVVVGKKAEQFVRRQGGALVASFTNLSVAPTIADLRPLARLVMEEFTEHRADVVRIVYTDFISSLRQMPRVQTLLPLQRMSGLGVGSESHPSPAPHASGIPDMLFEPNPQAVLDQVLPRLVELQVYQCVLESGASEHSARMLAMRSASDAAGEMIDHLTLTFNQARQSLITREIAEISAGRAALA
ncbi:ATP synthase F1 subunit gamma [Candidatus Uhrbacteria bacterium]|nr:ATP synthase F1 subunit gamma [Candidatus Uhrbacteria bacterium]